MTWGAKIEESWETKKVTSSPRETALDEIRRKWAACTLVVAFSRSGLSSLKSGVLPPYPYFWGVCLEDEAEEDEEECLWVVDEKGSSAFFEEVFPLPTPWGLVSAYRSAYSGGFRKCFYFGVPLSHHLGLLGQSDPRLCFANRFYHSGGACYGTT